MELIISEKIPSVNAMYENKLVVKKLGKKTTQILTRVLSKKASRLKNSLKMSIAAEKMVDITRLKRDIKRSLEEGQIPWLHLDVTFYFPTLNATYGKKRGAATPWKKVDVDNKLKFLIDTVTSAMGLDDSMVRSMVVRKLHAAQESTVIIITLDAWGD